MTTVAAQSPSRLKAIGFWILKAVLALLFLAAALFKLSGQPMMVAEFHTIGLGQWFRYFTGALEAAGAILLLIPAFTGLGAILLLIVSVGAFLAQLLVLHMDVIHTIVLALVLGAVAWTKRDQIFDRFGPARS
jgi:putative oxidoreductase